MTDNEVSADAVAHRKLSISEMVEQFLAHGFVPDFEFGERYLQEVAGSIENHGRKCFNEDKLFHEVLPGAIERQIGDMGHTEAMIPLSGGFDSRLLLGAALRVLPASSITCVTFGMEENEDLGVAREVCRKLGVRHIWIDPSAHYWTLDHVVEYARKRGDVVPGIFAESAARMSELVEFYTDPRAVLLSGYFGGFPTGQRLPVDHDHRDNIDAEVELFLRKNVVLRGIQREALADHSAWRRFLERNPWPTHLDGATPFEALDCAFRQGQRIERNLPGNLATMVQPFMDPIWMNHWFSLGLPERRRQKAYVNGIRCFYPEVFTEQECAEEPVTDRVRRRLRGILRKLRMVPERRGSLQIPTRFLERASPANNESLARMYREAAASFDSRELLSGVSAREAVERVCAGDYSAGNRAHWLVSAEVNLQAGNFHRNPRLQKE